jgi:hypothetical protein
MMNATGLNQTLGGAQNLRIITDVRSNALFVTGPKNVVRDVEFMLELLDSNELPQSLRDRIPRSIPVEYADIDEVADIIESVFKDAMTADPSQQQPQGFNPFAMMMGGGNRNAGANKKTQSIELSLGVDRRTSNLIVSCNDTMFRRVESMVKLIDDRAKEAHRTVRIVPLKTADPVVVQTTLTSLVPKITVSSTRSRSKKKDEPAAAAPAPGQAPDADLLRRSMQQNNSQPGGGTGGGRNRGGRGGGGQNGGGPPQGAFPFGGFPGGGGRGN